MNDMGGMNMNLMMRQMQMQMMMNQMANNMNNMDNFGDMMGGGGAMGQGGGLMKRFKAFRPDPAVEGRRIQIEGLPDEVEDSAVTKYFQVCCLVCGLMIGHTIFRGLVLLMAWGSWRRDGIEPRARSPTRSLAWLITLSSIRQIIFWKILSPSFVQEKKSYRRWSCGHHCES